MGSVGNRMLWTYTHATQALQEHLNEVFLDAVRAHQLKLLNEVPKKLGFEGDQHGINRADGTSDVRPYLHSNGHAQVLGHEDRPVSLRDAKEEFQKMGVAFARDMSVKFMTSINEQLEESGRVQNGTPSPEHILSLLDGMWIDFDGDGHPEWPTIHASKEVAEKMRAAWLEMVKNPTTREQLIALIKRKRNDWTERENCKFLAD